MSICHFQLFLRCLNVPILPNTWKPCSFSLYAISACHVFVYCAWQIYITTYDTLFSISNTAQQSCQALDFSKYEIKIMILRTGYCTWCTRMSIQLQDVALVAATAIGAPDVGACVLAQLARVELTLVNILLLLHSVGSFICGTDGEGFLGELIVWYWESVERRRGGVRLGTRFSVFIPHTYLMKLTWRHKTTSARPLQSNSKCVCVFIQCSYTFPVLVLHENKCKKSTVKPSLHL